MAEATTLEERIERAMADHRAGDLRAAEAGYRAALAEAPGHGAALGGLGALCFQTKRVADAVLLLERAAAVLTADAQLLANLGAAYATAGREAEAIDILQRAAALDPGNVEAWRNLASLLSNGGRWSDAMAAVDRLLAAAPQDPDALRRRADLHRRLGNLADAVAGYRALLAKTPEEARLWSGLAAALADQDALDPAIEAYRRAIALEPARPDHRTHLGNLLRRRGRLEEALAAQQEAVALAPDRAAAQINLGAVLHELGRNAEAIAAFLGASELDPASALAWYNLGTLHEVAGDTVRSLAAYRRAYGLDPENPTAAALLVRQLQQACAWVEAAPVERQVAADTRAALARGEAPAETTLSHLSRSMDPFENLAIARAASQRIAARVQGLPMPAISRAVDPDRRLRIGYLSSDYRDHPVAHLLGGLFERHDRSVVEVIAYSHGLEDGSAYRRRIAETADAFVDVGPLGFHAAARRIADDRIDILIDLNGFTGGARLEIAALRPAPVQVLWLGYPGTTGADFIDYLVTDRIVTPPEMAGAFREKLCWMPHSFQPNDDRQPIADRTLTRAGSGLPPDAPVFCSFNQGFKIEPVLFEAWMEILAALPGSVLWLASSHPEVPANLRREAKALGVASERLVFADRPPKDLHLKRLSLADLALDTRIYNGHTTTSDALWAGLPVVTLLGRHFASRVSASVLQAVGLPELVAGSIAEYKATVLRYARDGEALRTLKAKLAANRATAPLFDTERFVRNLESGYRAMWRRHAAGEAPASFDVEERR